MSFIQLNRFIGTESKPRTLEFESVKKIGYGGEKLTTPNLPNIAPLVYAQIMPMDPYPLDWFIRKKFKPSLMNNSGTRTGCHLIFTQAKVNSEKVLNFEEPSISLKLTDFIYFEEPTSAPLVIPPNVNPLKQDKNNIRFLMKHNRKVNSQANILPTENATTKISLFKDTLIENLVSEYKLVFCKNSDDIGTDNDKRLHMFGGLNLFDGGVLDSNDTVQFESLSSFSKIYSTHFTPQQAAYLIRHQISAYYRILVANAKKPDTLRMNDMFENLTNILDNEIANIESNELGLSP